MAALKLHAHSALCAQTDYNQTDALEKTSSLKVLVWSRGRLVTFQILTSFFWGGVRSHRTFKCSFLSHAV